MKVLIKYLKNREDAIRSLLDRSERTYTHKTFHKLRIEIKKLDAFFSLINFCTKDFNRKKNFKPFKLVFNQAGKIRELQLEEAMLKKYFHGSMLKEYRNNLKKQRLKERKDFFSMANDKLVRKLKKKYDVITPFLKKIKKKKVDVYVMKKRKQIEENLKGDIIQAPQIHELRKRLKKFHYSLNFLVSREPHKKQDEILSDLLGKWHDYQVIIGHLKKAMNTIKANPKEIEQLEKIRTNFLSESKQLFHRITIAIHYRDFLTATKIKP